LGVLTAGLVCRLIGAALAGLLMCASAKKNEGDEDVQHGTEAQSRKSNARIQVKSRKQAVAIAMSESGQSKRRKKAS
jgi:hypothetical protein